MADNTFSLQIICPDRVFYEGEVKMLELNTIEGEVGIYKDHMPMTMIIAPGVLQIRESDDTVKMAALHSGFVEVLPEKITVLAEVAEWPDEIDLNRAQEAKERAQKRLDTKDSGTDMARAQTALMRAIARIHAVK